MIQLLKRSRFFVYVQDDKENTGGYLILISQEKKSNVGYDASATPA